MQELKIRILKSKSGIFASKPEDLLTPSSICDYLGVRKAGRHCCRRHGKKGLPANAIWFGEALLRKILWRSSNVPQANAYISSLVTL